MKTTKEFFKGIAVAVITLFAAGIFAFPAVADQAFKTVTTDELKTMLDKKQRFFLVDSRTKQEYEEAHIPLAVNISDKKLKENMGLLPADRNMLIVIYCNGVKCGKSMRLAKQLELLGYKNIRIYSEGIPVWEERNLRLATGPEYSKKIETRKLKPAEVSKLIQTKKGDYVLVDVRDATEFKEGHIPTAINIPAETFSSKSGILPKEKKIIVYCNTGSRSYLAYRKLIGLAYPDIYQTLLMDWKAAGLALEK